MKSMKHKVLLIAIVVLAFVLRIYQVAAIPPALSWDEVSIGYNAYSILKVGKDEHGKFLPVDVFAGYGDYKPPLTIYLTVPSIAIFGLNEFSVRLPSVLFGTLTVLLTFFLVKELFGLSTIYDPRSTIAALLLTISPWHIQLSRGGFEANIATFFIALGVCFVAKARNNSRYLLWCWLPFVAGIYTFNSARYVGPLLGAGLLVWIFPTIKKHWKQTLLGMALALVLLMPIVPHLVSKEARLRFAEVNIFSDVGIVETANARIAHDKNKLVAGVVDNRRLGYAREYLKHFFDNLEPNFLFIHGDGNPKFSIQDVGQLYLIEAPLLILGIFWVFTMSPSIGWLFAYWVIVSLIPAGVARETPHALRIENSLPVWQMWVAFGIMYVVSVVKKRSWKRVVVGVLIFAYSLNVGFYLHNYYRHYAREFSSEWQYGYKQAIAYAETHKAAYRTIVLTESIGRPYMYVLFYTKYDPTSYRQSVHEYFDAAGFYHVDRFGQYEFVKESVVSWKDNTLYILAPQNVPAGAHVVQTIQNLKGEPVLVAFEKP